ncbi:thioesterase II family protein [Streptomyces sp. TR06-5]|uniref:thioesterase II family protein n=1 Tax=unclassified Streptomyces TaxID=2593676 RepID=UPI00399F6D04
MTRPSAPHIRPLRLFCLPYAGGSAARIYHDWARLLPEHVELWPLELPGRGSRMVETPCSTVDALVDDLVHTALGAIDGPYALFGHSLGGLLAFELARRLEHAHRRPAAHLLVSAFEAPDLPTEPDRDHLLPDDEFRLRLHELAGTPKEVIDNDDLMELLIPVLRADFTAVNTYRLGSPWLRLNCPLTVFGGLDDPEAPPHTLRAWQHRSTGPFRLRLLPGDHFFLHTEQSLLIDAVLDALDTAEADAGERRERKA